MILNHILDISQIIFADIILSGDNALIIGMAAAGLSPEYRKRAIFLGMAAAAIFRIIFTLIASYLLSIEGILFFGGVLLGFVCWRFFSELRQKSKNEKNSDKNLNESNLSKLSEKQKMFRALLTITIADISMSIDNVLAVAAIARENTFLLIFGLALAIIFMAFFATLIMKLLNKYFWLSWLGLFFLVYLTIEMIISGWPGMIIQVNNFL